jgi:type IV secretory pathway VirD2 relaxase
MFVMGPDKKPVLDYLTHRKNFNATDAVLFGPGGVVDRQRFVADIARDPHQFRLSISLPHNPSYFGWRAYVETFLQRVERDLGRPLRWVAAIHRDTDNHHAHVVIGGRDRDGRDLAIMPSYLKYGLRYRAAQIATQFLGPDRSPRQSLRLSRDTATTEAPIVRRTPHGLRQTLGP